MATDPQSRRWNLTINNPQNAGFDHDLIIEKMLMFNPTYFCMADEIGAEGTYHTHMYFCTKSPVRFSTIHRRLPVAHIEKAIKSSFANREYFTKTGKWSDTPKAQTTVEGTFYEWGEIPTEAEEESPGMFEVLKCVQAGMSNVEIIRQKPSLAFRLKNIDEVRDALQAERFMQENRQIMVSYLWGDSGTGKTKSIFEKHDPRDICRITDYGGKNGIRFDSYHGQSVLVFEEFHSQIPIATMLNLLDVYPLQLPARYHDRTACYTTVYITSNIALEEQYQALQITEPETWNALMRRISRIVEFRKGQPPKEVKNNDEEEQGEQLVLDEG